MRVFLMLGFVCILCGCNKETVRDAFCIDRPSRPTLTRVSADDLQCLSDDSYLRVIQRETQIKEYAEALETLIDGTCGGNDGTR